MFFHRLKIEFRENRIYTLIWILVLATLTISTISIWNRDLTVDPVTGRPEHSMSDLFGLLIVALIALPIFSTITSFRQDNLKDPRAFWNTRPIRPTTLHSTKFVFLHLVFTLPLALCTFLVSINATSMGSSLIYAAEAALWSAAAIHLCALAALHDHQLPKLLLFPAIGLLGIVTTALLISRFENMQPNMHHPGRFEGNLLFATALLLILFVIAGAYLIKKPRTKIPFWAPLLIGALTFPLLSADWLPNFSQPTKSQEYQPSETLTNYNTSTSRINLQYFHELNYTLEDLIGESDRIPIRLVSQQTNNAPLHDFHSGIQAKMKLQNSGVNEFASPKNLETIAFDQENSPTPQFVFSLSIPFDNLVMATPKVDDLPRKDITFEGAVDILTASLEDAHTIEPGQQFTSRTPGSFFSFHPSTKKSQRDIIQSKNFRLPLASSEILHPDHRGSTNSIIAMRHRESGQYFLLQKGSSSTQYGAFGKVEYSELQILEETSMVNYHWTNQLQKKLPDFPDFNDWKKDADLLILPPEQFKTVRIPFKITVSVPDLDLLQQRLNKAAE